MCGNNDSGNSMPESRKAIQAIEWLIDIRGRGVGSSGFLVFDSGRLSGGNEQESSTAAFSWFAGPQPICQRRRHKTSFGACLYNCCASLRIAPVAQ
jgi:hypothetical protein